MLDVEHEPRHVIEHVLVVPPLTPEDWPEEVRVVEVAALVQWLDRSDEFEALEDFAGVKEPERAKAHAKSLVGDPQPCAFVGLWRYLGIKGDDDIDGARAGHQSILRHVPAAMSLTQWREQGGGANGPVFFMWDQLANGHWTLVGVDALLGFVEMITQGY